MKRFIIALSLLCQISYANAGQIPQVGRFVGQFNGEACSFEVTQVVTDKNTIIELNQRDLKAGVLDESELPNYMLVASLNGGKKRVVSGAENFNNLTAEQKARGVFTRLSGGGGLLPLPLAWAMEIAIDGNREPMMVAYVTAPFGGKSGCENLQRVR